MIVKYLIILNIYKTKLSTKLLNELLKKQEISDKVYNELYPAGSRPGILYGHCN